MTDVNEIVVDKFPRFEIIELAHWQAGRCYYRQDCRVRSVWKLTPEDIEWMHKFVMQGQGYHVKEQFEDGKPSGRYRKGDVTLQFYEYLVECAVDSGD